MSGPDTHPQATFPEEPTPSTDPTWETVPVADLLGWLDPQYRIDGLCDTGEVDPHWAKVARFADAMRAGRFDYAASPITLVSSRSGTVVFDGNHRVLAADQAGVAVLPVWRTTRPLG